MLFIYFQSQQTLGYCISQCSPCFVCWAWRHGKYCICGDTLKPKNSSNNVQRCKNKLKLIELHIINSHLNKRHHRPDLFVIFVIGIKKNSIFT